MKMKEENEKVGLKLNIQKTKIMASSLIFSWHMENKWKQWETIFLGCKITADGDWSHEIRRHLLLGRKVMTNLDSVLKSKDITLLTKVHLVKAMVFPVVVCWCDSRTMKKAEHQRIMLLNCGVGEDSWEFLGLQETKPVNPKGNQSWMFVRSTDGEPEAPMLWSPDSKRWLTEKYPDAGKDRRHEEKGMTEDEMFGWHHRLNGHESAQPRDMVKGREAWHAAVYRVAESDTTGATEEQPKIRRRCNRPTVKQDWIHYQNSSPISTEKHIGYGLTK